MANALAVLLAGAPRALEPAGPPSLDAVPGLAALVDSVCDAVADVAGPDGVAKLRAKLDAQIGEGATQPRPEG